ncbi:MAG: PAS domain S-box protein [bacterium]
MVSKTQGQSAIDGHHTINWQEAIFEGSPDAIFISDENSNFIMVNKAASKLTGYTKNDLLKMKILDLHDKVDLHAPREFHANIMNDDEITTEAPILRRDGSKVDTEFNHRRILIHGKRYVHMVARDITDRKRTERALREMEVALTNALTGISRICASGKYLKVNQPYAEMLGYTPDELIGRSWQPTVVPEDQPLALSAYKRMQREGKAEFEARAIRKDGSQFYKHVLMVREMNEKNRFIGHHCFMRDISDRKKAEQAIKNSEERYRVLYQENPSMCFTVDAQGIVISVNKTGAKQLGYMPEELLGQPVINVFYEEDKEAIQKQLQDCLKKPNEVATWELRKVRKDGSIVWVREIARAVQEVQGELSIFIVCENITERKLAEQALRLNKERYDLAVEAGKVGVWDWNIETNEIYLDPKLKKMLGYENSEIRNHLDNWTRHVHPDDLAQVKEKVRNHLKGKSPVYECEHRMLHKDGSVRWFLARGVATRVPNGKAFRMTGSYTDITERKLADEALKQSEQRFRDFFDNAPDIYVILDPAGTVIDCNKRGLDKLGYKKVKGKNKRFTDFVHSGDVKKIESLLNTIKETEKIPRNIEVRLLSREKEVIWVFLEFSILKTKTGDLQASRIACRDITDRKRLQMQLARAQRLETAGRVAGQIAHDFNNLLAPLTGYPDIIRTKLPKNHPIVDYINEMELSANEIAEISQQLLALGRRGYYKLEPLDLNQLIRTVVSTQAFPSETRLHTDLNPDLFLIKGGKSQLTRVLSNLLNNAREAMNDRGMLSVKTENVYLEKPTDGYQTIAAGEYVKVSIRDTGIGIEPDILDKIFDPFFTTKKMDGLRGSGLGLSVVHGILKDHCGYVTVESKVGQGTTFSLYFPITREVITQEQKDEDGLIGGREKILVVDDDPVQRRVTEEILKSLGYKVTALERGDKAVMQAKKQKIDLLVVDMVMDGLDGVQTYQEILKLNPGQKAIIVSGYAVSAQVKKALQLGAGAFLHKPLKMKTLARTVREVLDGDLPA